MAQRKRKGAKVNPKAAARQKAGGDTAGSIITNVALFAIPGGGLARIAMVGGKVAPKALQALRRMFPSAKRVSKPTKAQVDRAKPVSALKPVAKPSGPATRGGRRGPRKNEVIEGKATEKKVPAGSAVTTPKVMPKPKPKPADKKPGTAVTTRPGTQVKKPGTGVMEIRQAPKTPRGMKMANATDKARELKKVRANIAAAKRANNASLVKKLIAAAVAAGLVGSAAMLGGGTDKPAAGGAGKKKTVPTPTPKPKQKKRKPTGTYERTPVETSKPKKPTRKPSGPQTRGSQKRGATPRVSAGPNTGFGPKGNIFPSNAAERAALMKMYGGTGSAAAKAAADGKQGDLVAGKAAYEKAKRERLKGKK